MALEQNAETPIIIGNDHLVRLSNVVDADGALLDMSAWTTVKWFLRRRESVSTTILEKTATRSGTYDVDPDVNTQVWTASLTDEETILLSAGLRRYAWKRDDAGAEADLAYGTQDVIRTSSR